MQRHSSPSAYTLTKRHAVSPAVRLRLSDLTSGLRGTCFRVSATPAGVALLVLLHHIGWI